MTVGTRPRTSSSAREARPGQRVLPLELLDPVGQRSAVVVQVEQDAVVLDRRRQVVLRPDSRDVGAQRVEALDQSELAVLLQLEAGRERQVAAAALARDDDALGVDAERAAFSCSHCTPDTQSFRPAGKGSTSGSRGSREAVPEVHHRDRHALGRDDPAPRLVHAVEARHGLHAAPVDVVDARQRPVGLGPDQLDLDRVAVGRGLELVGPQCRDP